MDKLEIKINRTIGTPDGYVFETEKGKFKLSFKEMAQYAGTPLPEGKNIQIALKDEGYAELAIGRMVLNVPEYLLQEKGLI
ncbi:MAG: hypothetical protein OSJ76_07720 [Alphaproteobacteria bacterium]|nr:hypothetical protein [Alphaproteobacteria bacterium]